MEATGTLDMIKAARTISLGSREASTPFSYTGNDNQPWGYSVDPCTRVLAAIVRQLAIDERPTCQRVSGSCRWWSSSTRSRSACQAARPTRGMMMNSLLAGLAFLPRLPLWLLAAGRSAQACKDPRSE